MPIVVRKPIGSIADYRRSAKAALDVFQKNTGSDDCDAVSDLVSDLMHYASSLDQEPLEEVRRAIRHWYAETHHDGWPTPADIEIVVEVWQGGKAVG